MTVDPAFMLQLIKNLKDRGVVFDGSPTRLQLFYDSKTREFIGFRDSPERRETSRISVDDPRLVEKLTAQCLHLLEYGNV